MPRYFFDIYDSDITIDDIGQELSDLPAVRKMAMQVFPRIAADEIPDAGDKRHFVVVARDEQGFLVYTATLSYVGLSLPLPRGH